MVGILHPTGVDTEAGEGNPAHTPVLFSATHGTISLVIRMRLLDIATHPVRRVRITALRQGLMLEIHTLHGRITRHNLLTSQATNQGRLRLTRIIRTSESSSKQSTRGPGYTMLKIIGIGFPPRLTRPLIGSLLRYDPPCRMSLSNAKLRGQRTSLRTPSGTRSRNTWFEKRPRHIGR